MKRSLAFALLVPVLCGCVSVAKPAPKAASRATVYTVRGLRASWQWKDFYPGRIFEVGEQRFSTLEQFKQFIRTLPRGSTVQWSSGCVRYDSIPLAQSDMSIEAFQDYCNQYGVTFVYSVPGY